jgi:hypothetical protein
MQSSCNNAGYSGDGGVMGEGSFENAQATDAHNRFDFAGLNERHDDGGTFSDENRVTQSFRFALQILNRAEAALLAKETKFVEGRRTFALISKAFGQQEQAAFIGHGGKRLAPHLIV